jgi:hypothetical protein
MTEERKLFDELMDGIDAMQQQRVDQNTLRSKGGVPDNVRT